MGDVSHDLHAEIETYQAHRERLERESYGLWVLVHGTEPVGIFNDFESAAREAVEKFGRGPYLIRQIGEKPRVLPASVVYTSFPYGH